MRHFTLRSLPRERCVLPTGRCCTLLSRSPPSAVFYTQTTTLSVPPLLYVCMWTLACPLLASFHAMHPGQLPTAPNTDVDHHSHNPSGLFAWVDCRSHTSGRLSSSPGWATPLSTRSGALPPGAATARPPLPQVGTAACCPLPRVAAVAHRPLLCSAGRVRAAASGIIYISSILSPAAHGSCSLCLGLCTHVARPLSPLHMPSPPMLRAETL